MSELHTNRTIKTHVTINRIALILAADLSTVILQTARDRQPECVLPRLQYSQLLRTMEFSTLVDTDNAGAYG